MSGTNNIYAVDTLVGMTVLSRLTANKLGQVDDLIIDPIKGILLGVIVRTADNSIRALEYEGIYSFGQDAVMANEDEAVLPLEDTLLAGPPGAKKDLIGAKIITEGGKLLGHIANVYVHLTPPPLAIYEVRESLLDKLLGRASYIPASIGRALSDKSERIIVPANAAENAADSLEALANRLIGELTTEHQLEEETVVRKLS